MEYLSPQQAKAQSGLRLALTAHMPAPYSMSARAVLDHYQVPYAAVEQVGAGANDALVEWTGHRNAPIAVYNDEASRVGWLDILNLAHRLGIGPSLFPENIQSRLHMIGMINELIGENGWVWNMRLIMLGVGGPERSAKAAQQNPMYADYGYSEETRQLALEKATAVLEHFTEFAKQSSSLYFYGSKLSALDLYWVFFSNLVKTLPEADCPMPSGLRKSYDLSGQALGGCDPILIEHRDHILAKHLSLPMTF